MKPSKKKEKPEITKWWWVLPVILGFIGGFVAWLFNREKDNDKAIIMLILGIALTVVGLLMISLMAGLMVGLINIPTLEAAAGGELYLCTNSEILIHKAIFDHGSSELTLMIYNTGEVPLTGFQARLTYRDGSTESLDYESLRVADNDIESLTVHSYLTLEKAEVVSKQCAGTKDVISRDAIIGLGF